MPTPPLFTRRLALAMAPGVLAFTAGCAAHRRDVVLRPGPPVARPTSVALAPAVLLHAGQLELAPGGAEVRARVFTPDQEEAGATEGDTGSNEPTPEVAALLDVFYANYYVGKVWHSGGYEYLPEVGNQVRSLGLRFSQQAAYAAQAQEWTDATMGEVLTERGVSWSPVTASVESALQPPRRRTVRGTGPLDGEDNQNLPRFELIPQPLDPGALPEIDADTLLVPIIVHYYAHNGGWFVGQSRGCAAGARFRLLWVLHDSRTGAVRTWGDIAARYVEDYFYTPNDVQLQDYLMAVEARVRGALERELLR
ncbi:MAG: hypothetical protein D6798_14260 [Deltaproteobacteria bacterium]|nr:MAG: hypothetical protein D6798_14260 [Deltaproteobacteria bacterium]